MPKKRVCEPPVLALSATFSPNNAILGNTLLLCITFMLHISDEAEEAFPGQGSTEGNEDQDEEMEDDFDPG